MSEIPVKLGDILVPKLRDEHPEVPRSDLFEFTPNEGYGWYFLAPDGDTVYLRGPGCRQGLLQRWTRVIRNEARLYWMDMADRMEATYDPERGPNDIAIAKARATAEEWKKWRTS